MGTQPYSTNRNLCEQTFCGRPKVHEEMDEGLRLSPPRLVPGIRFVSGCPQTVIN